MKKIGIAVLAGIVGIGITFYVFTTIQSQPTASLVEKSVVSEASTSVTYAGESGQDALTLLRRQASIEQDDSGLVISINNVTANPSSQEYWAFYVNEEMAPVGPQEYQTKDGDTIEWRLEKF